MEMTIQHYSNFLIMRRYLFCITTFVLLVKSPLPSYFFMNLFRDGTGVPAFISTSNVRIRSSSGLHDDLWSGWTTTSPRFLWYWCLWFHIHFPHPGTSHNLYSFACGGIKVDGGGTGTCCRGVRVVPWI